MHVTRAAIRTPHLVERVQRHMQRDQELLERHLSAVDGMESRR
jgi:hypothetical protein